MMQEGQYVQEKGHTYALTWGTGLILAYSIGGGCTSRCNSFPGEKKPEPGEWMDGFPGIPTTANRE